MRTIAHIDADAFYASVELLRRPDLIGKPVIVAGRGQRAVVTTASYEARKFGVGSAMSASRAARLCPDAIWLTPDFTYYRAISARMMGVLRDRITVVETLGLDEAYLDLSQEQDPTALMRELVARIKAECGITVSVGIGPNKLVAKVASDAEKPAGFVEMSAESAYARYCNESPGMLNGIGPKTVERLSRMGISTITELAESPVDALTNAFGPRSGQYLQARAWFADESPVAAVRILKSKSNETTFADDVDDADEIRDTLKELATGLAKTLQTKQLAGRTIGIKVRTADWETHTRAHTFAEATNDADQLFSVGHQLLLDLGNIGPLRLIGIRSAGFEAPAPPPPSMQLSLFDLEERTEPESLPT
jgi:DNA polymerase-4